ncbi:MAG TPA: hypothetical protein VN666_15420 [Nitrospira sp.]|nr:hypothetical protein [Nitrospira sp.]
MNSATAFRFLILVIPAVWMVIRLLPAEHPRYGNLKVIASQVEQDRLGRSTERDKETFDKVREPRILV